MELLIVIGILGILAAGLLAAIDPFEQLKKARDTNNRSATLSLLSGFTSFYANHGAFPWNLTTPSANCKRAAANDPLFLLGKLTTNSMEIHNMEACLTESVIADGELKDTYMAGIGATQIFVASDKTDLTNLWVCYAPEGKAARLDASTKYLVTGAADPYTIVEQTGLGGLTACPNTTGAAVTCAQCFK